MSKLDKFKRRNKSNEGVNSAIADLMSGTYDSLLIHISCIYE